MSTVSFSFLLFVCVVLLLYYFVPKRYRWLVLLAGSVFYFWSVSGTRLLLVFLGICLMNYLAAIGIVRIRKKQDASPNAWKAKVVYGAVVFADAALLVLYKDSDFFHAHLIAPIGISYFTLILIGYLTDVYWGKFDAEPNFLKLTLFTGYFPQMASGPFVKYDTMRGELFAPKIFNFENLVFGVERVIWGFFKKLVIAERLSVIVNAVYGDFVTYNGFYVWVAVGAFMLQLYADFSGAMDIVIGVSECFGIQLPENFQTPFYAVSIQEFWKRWHITLGAWLREYVFYPVLRSRLLSELRRWCKKRWGKDFEKRFNLPLYLGLFVTWFLIGFWHGGKWNYIWGSGLYYWLLIVLGDIFAPLLQGAVRVLKINTQCWSWRFFQRVRTAALFAFGLSFFRSESIAAGVALWKSAFAVNNVWVLFDGSLYDLGLDRQDFSVLVYAMMLLFIVEHYKTRMNVRKTLAKQNYLFRLAVVLLMAFGVVIFGKYGANYVASAFIYEQF